MKSKKNKAQAQLQTETSSPPSSFPSKDMLVDHLNFCKNPEAQRHNNNITFNEDKLDSLKIFSHFVLLNQLKKLELEDENMDARYLLRAINRYMLWLKLLNGQGRKEDMPIPPIDVCCIWHVHCLSP